MSKELEKLKKNMESYNKLYAEKHLNLFNKDEAEFITACGREMFKKLWNDTLQYHEDLKKRLEDLDEKL